MNWKRFGHAASTSTSCEEFGVWGKALMVSFKIEGLPNWTKISHFLLFNHWILKLLSPTI